MPAAFIVPRTRLGHPIGINRSQEYRQDAGLSVGASGGGEGSGGPLWSPGVPVPCAHTEGNTIISPPSGDHKGPPHAHSAALAPTDVDGLFVRLMPTRVATNCLLFH